MSMEYRHLGRGGVKVSVLSFGSWVSFGPQLAGSAARDCLATAFDAGINFFDNAEVYARGRSEEIMGAAIKELRWSRNAYLISTKFFWGIEDTVNTRNTLNRKYLLQAIDGSLRRLQHDFVDLVFCHRPDPETPIEETVFAMHTIVESGKALYWGTSEWSPGAVQEAYDIAERHHLHKPLMEQPQYNLVTRENVERRLAPLCDRLGLGLTVWSPLASGLLSGKYAEGVPEGSRASLSGYEWLRDMVTDPAANARVKQLAGIAGDLGVTTSQLAIAWCAGNPNVSTVITGASRVEQVRENLGALGALRALTPEVRSQLDSIFPV
jgi:voltage-dependent potassium channel beta subunit